MEVGFQQKTRDTHGRTVWPGVTPAFPDFSSKSLLQVIHKVFLQETAPPLANPRLSAISPSFNANPCHVSGEPLEVGCILFDGAN